MRTGGDQRPGRAARLVLSVATTVYRLYYATLRVRLLHTDGDPRFLSRPDLREGLDSRHTVTRIPGKSTSRGPT